MNKNWFTYRNILTVIAIVFAIWFVWKFYVIILYFLIAAIISLLGRPVMDLLEKIKFGKFKFPTALAALISMSVLIGVIILVAAAFVPVLTQKATEISNLNTERASEAIQGQMENIDEFILRFQDTNQTGIDSMQTNQQTVEATINSKLREWLNITSIQNILSSLLGSIGNIIVGVFSIVFISFFFLRDEKLFYNILMTLAPTRFEPHAKRILSNSKRTLTRYAGGIIIQSIVVFILVWGGLMLMGSKNALIIAFFCAIMNVIPYLGPIIGTLFALLIELTTVLSEDPYAPIVPMILKLVILIQGVQLIDNYISQPIIFSKRIKAHPLEIFFIVLVFGSLGGIPGMIIAVPVYSFMRIIAKEFFSEYKIVRKITEDIET
jgi:predicted PurR-regulated permease PerM